MILIFSLNRKNVISFDYLAIKRGMCNLYGYDNLTIEDFEKHKKNYEPYATIASFYIWAKS